MRSQGQGPTAAHGPIHRSPSGEGHRPTAAAFSLAALSASGSQWALLGAMG